MTLDVRRPLVLASASPRRRALLTQIGVPLAVRPVDVDETRREGEAPQVYLERVVGLKEAAARRRVDDASLWVLVADTAVVVDGEVLGKPRDDEEGREMLGRLSGRDHEVATRFALFRGADAVVVGDRAVRQTVSTRVWFRPLDDTQVQRYVATGEGRDKAGGYAIQGIGAMLVARIEGSYSAVVGLPLAEVAVALTRQAGWPG
ncbi:MAG: nucleoside triphosphate pyrophosphatase [Myxococcota bacterium]